MEVARLHAFFRKHQHVALDTCIFIYQWEGNPHYSPVTNLIFSSIEHSSVTAVTSTITMTELLVHPYRTDDVLKTNELIALLSTAQAAEIRALYRLRSPDALQAATAVQARASAFITNDPVFQRITKFETLILDKFV
ncbi:MAG: hypothetical protein DMG79_11635 [Acidobacteria bacterium]|nr:MAG: hypothetical protein DMG79_11635 [Acidobacteriota bacterium]